jgi:molecular chaperone DnaJ
MAGKDYYQVLGVSKSASADEIKAAFRKLAHQHHPDKGGDQEKFKEANAAYQVLGDPEKRKQYDQFGSAAFEGGAGGFSGGGFNWQGGNVDFGDLGDLFGDFFGGGRGQSARGRDLQMEISLTFLESIFGAEKEVTLNKTSDCERCGGNGSEPGTSLKTCSDCSGQGYKTVVQRTIIGAVQTRANCPTCHGAGEVPEKACTACRGEGYQNGKRTLRVDIPAGVEHGSRIRVRAQGESIGVRGEPGDLYLLLRVANDPRFVREGSNLYTEKKIGFTQAALGDEVDVETVDGPVKLKIPAGTQSGEKLRLRGKGVKTGHGRGDQIVQVIVVTPKKLDREQRKLFEQLNLSLQ